MIRVAIVAIALAAACKRDSEPAPPSAPAPAVAAKPPPAPVPPRAPPPPPAATPAMHLDVNPKVLAAPDLVPGKRTRRRTAVLLIVPAPNAWHDLDAPAPTANRFLPLVCAIDGVLATGARCGEIMPARATIRTATGSVTVARATKPFHDTAGEHDYPAPYGPECCMYNTCVGKTVPYLPPRGRAFDQRTAFGVWPDDADIALEVAGDGNAGVAAAELPPLGRDDRIVQAFARGASRYVTISGDRSDRVVWSAGSGWIDEAAPMMTHGYRLLATADLDGDGRLEAIAYELDANDYGITVFGAATYAFSCGNA